MKICFHILSILSVLNCLAQKGVAVPTSSFKIYQNDTINRTDSLGKKQGFWILLGKDKPGTCYKEDQVIEKGFYKDNRKTGIWEEFYCNGNLKNKLTFVSGRPDGYAIMYHENGNKSEEGTWRINRWIGKSYQYDESGRIIRISIYDPVTKLRSNCCFSATGELIDCYPRKHYFDSIPETEKIKEGSSLNNVPLNGKHTLYNKNRQITKDGIFENNQFMEGKAYIYDENGILVRVAIYKGGKYVGDAPVDK